MTSEDKIYLGTRLKYVLEIEASGFSMDTDNFCVDLIRGPKVIHLEKGELEYDDENWYVCFDTNELGPGIITAKVTAYVPDTDFADGIRTEVQKITLEPVYY